MIIKTYIATDPEPGFEAVAHVYERDKKGVLHMLPATAYGSGPDAAAERLKAFLDAEIAAAAKLAANRLALSERRRRAP